MGTDRDRRRCRERIERLADADLNSVEVRTEAANDLSRTLGFGRFCWPISDPASLLAHSGIAQVDYWELLPRMIVLDQLEADSTRTVIAQSPRPASSLHAQTHGDLASDRRWRECQEPFGMGDELTVACRDERGVWGWLAAHVAAQELTVEAALERRFDLALQALRLDPLCHRLNAAEARDLLTALNSHNARFGGALPTGG